MSIWQSELYGNYRNRTFSDIFPSKEVFITEYSNTEFSALTSEINLSIVYYLLYAEHANDPISNADENQFKYRLWSIIFMAGPSWAKRLDIQAKLRGLTEAELMLGGKAIYNHAMNDGGAPNTTALKELEFINDQNTTNYLKSKMEGYENLLMLLDTDVTKEFINRFKPLFLKFVAPEEPLWYKDESEDLV